MQPLSTMSVPQISDLVKKSFQQYKPQNFGDVKDLFHFVQGTSGERTKRILELDRQRLAKTKVQGQGSAKAKVAEGYYKDIERKTVSITRVLTGENKDDITAHGLGKWATEVKDDVVGKAELDMTNLFGYASGTSYTDNGGFAIDTTTGDGKSFANNAHTLKHSSATYSNIVSGAPALSEAGLEVANDMFVYNTKDNYGQRIVYRANALLITRNTRMQNRADRILGSSAPEKIEGTANANSGVKNSWKNRFTVKTIEFDLTAKEEYDANKKYYWAIASIGNDPATTLQAYFVSWKKAYPAPPEIDQDKFVISFTARALYGIGVVSGRGIAFSFATS